MNDIYTGLVPLNLNLKKNNSDNTLIQLLNSQKWLTLCQRVPFSSPDIQTWTNVIRSPLLLGLPLVRFVPELGFQGKGYPQLSGFQGRNCRKIAPVPFFPKMFVLRAKQALFLCCSTRKSGRYQIVTTNKEESSTGSQNKLLLKQGLRLFY